MNKNYDRNGQRTTDCCGCYSTYMDGGSGGDMILCCKKCHNPVSLGQGDGSEFLTAGWRPITILGFENLR